MRQSGNGWITARSGGTARSGCSGEPAPPTIWGQPVNRVLLALAVLAALLPATSARAFIDEGPLPDLGFATELEDMELTAELLMPLTGGGLNNGTPEDPSYGNMRVKLTITESLSALSLGSVSAWDLGDGYWQVDSFFDVFVDIELADIDDVYDFSNDAPMIQLLGVHAGTISTNFFTYWDPNLPNGGLFPPPETSPYTLDAPFQVPLGFDVNGNEEEDFLDIQEWTWTWLGADRKFVFVPTRVVHNVKAQTQLSGKVRDALTDPPFGPITLTGPTTASAQLVYRPPTIPEPSSVGLLTAGLAMLLRRRRRR